MKSADGSSFSSLINQVLVEIEDCVRRISSESLVQAAELIEEAPRIFVAGAGRSGLAMRALGMRVMHLGKTVFVVGETATPSITSGDLLILGSGSGATPTLLPIAGEARQYGANILLFTADRLSPLAGLADCTVVIPAKLFEAAHESKVVSVQPLNSLFEQSLLLVCDTLVLNLMQQMNVDARQMAERHSNLQ
jgi:6-phospho-3-hexuloisomerase